MTFISSVKAGFPHRSRPCSFYLVSCPTTFKRVLFSCFSCSFSSSMSSRSLFNKSISSLSFPIISSLSCISLTSRRFSCLSLTTSFSRSSILFSKVLLEEKLAGAFASLLCLLKPLLSVRGYLFEISSSGALVVLLYLPGTVLDGSCKAKYKTSAVHACHYTTTTCREAEQCLPGSYGEQPCLHLTGHTAKQTKRTSIWLFSPNQPCFKV